jgi:hypothetical protein
MMGAGEDMHGCERWGGTRTIRGYHMVDGGGEISVLGKSDSRNQNLSSVYR